MQRPIEHAGVPRRPEGHTVPHAPQLSGSDMVLTHDEPQRWFAGATQPLVHAYPPGAPAIIPQLGVGSRQVLVHAPQRAAVVTTASQPSSGLPEQFARPGRHAPVNTQRPAAHVTREPSTPARSVQSLPQRPQLWTSVSGSVQKPEQRVRHAVSGATSTGAMSGATSRVTSMLTSIVASGAMTSGAVSMVTSGARSSGGATSSASISDTSGAVSSVGDLSVLTSSGGGGAGSAAAQLARSGSAQSIEARALEREITAERSGGVERVAGAERGVYRRPRRRAQSRAIDRQESFGEALRAPTTAAASSFASGFEVRSTRASSVTRRVLSPAV